MILIVDDDSAMAENCSMLLESHGYQVRVALSGAEALAKIKALEPKLLISDCCMPDISGVELTRQLNAESGGSSFPILLMSGSLQCDVAPGNSYNAFIKKPFLAENLLLQIEKLLAIKALSPPANSTEQL